MTDLIVDLLVISLFLGSVFGLLMFLAWIEKPHPHRTRRRGA